MKRISQWLKPALPALALTLWFGACSERGAPSEQLLGPDQAEFSKGGNGAGWGGQRGGRKSPTVSETTTGKSWKLATGKLSVADSLKSEAVIGPDGGYLRTHTHVLYVPKGAVSQPTRFKIQAFRSPVDASVSPDSVEVVVGVALKAYSLDAAGNVLADVGALGFNTPVYLALSYAWVSEVIPDLTQAKILWLKSTTEAQLTKTFQIDYNGKWIVSELQHFSDYAIGFPNFE